MAKVNVRPLGDRVLVQHVEEAEVKKGGIIIPDTAKEKPQEGKVIALGTGKRDEDGKIIPFTVKAGDKVLVNFPAANRDPAQFPDADKVIIDREINRHVAFGAGIHRCAGSNLARMELRVAVEEWLARIPEFELVPGAEVTWAGGQVRGPRTVPVRFPA